MIVGKKEEIPTLTGASSPLQKQDILAFDP